MLVQKRKEKNASITVQKEQMQENLNKNAVEIPEEHISEKKHVDVGAENVLDEKQVEAVLEKEPLLDANIQEAEDAVDIEKDKALAEPEMEHLSIAGSEALKDKELIKENIQAVAEIIQQDRQAHAQQEERKEKKILVPDLHVFEECLASLQRESGSRTDSFNRVRTALTEFVELAKNETANGRAISDALLEVRKAGVAYYNSHRGHRSWLFGGHRRKETIERVVKACEDYVLSDDIEVSMRRYILQDIRKDPAETGKNDVKKKKFFDRAAKQMAPYLKDRFDDVSFGFIIDKNIERDDEEISIAMEKSQKQGERTETGFWEFDRMGFLMKDYIRVNGKPASPEDQRIEDENVAMLNKFYSNSIEDRKDLVKLVLKEVLSFQFKPEMLTLEYIRENYAQIRNVGINLANYQNVIENDSLNYAAFLSLPEEVQKDAYEKADMLNALSYVADSVVQMHNISTSAGETFRSEDSCHPISKVKSPKWLTKLVSNFEKELKNYEFDATDEVFVPGTEESDDYSFGDGSQFSKVEILENGKQKISGKFGTYWQTLVLECTFIKNKMNDYDRLSKNIEPKSWEDKISLTDRDIEKRVRDLPEDDVLRYQEFRDTIASSVQEDIQNVKERAKALKNNGAAAGILIGLLEGINDKLSKICGLIDVKAGGDIAKEAKVLNRQYEGIRRSLESVLKDGAFDYKEAKEKTDVRSPLDAYADIFEERLRQSKNEEEDANIRTEIEEASGAEAAAEYDIQNEMFERHMRDFAKSSCLDNPFMSYRDARSAYVRRAIHENIRQAVFTPDVVAKMKELYPQFKNDNSLQNRAFECRCKSVMLNENGEPASELSRRNLEYNKALMQAYLDKDVHKQEETLDEIVDFINGDQIQFDNLFSMEYMAKHFNDEWYVMYSKYSLTTDIVNKFEHHKNFFKKENLEKRYGKEKADKFLKRSEALVMVGGMLDSCLAGQNGYKNTGVVTLAHEGTKAAAAKNMQAIIAMRDALSESYHSA